MHIASKESRCVWFLGSDFVRCNEQRAGRLGSAVISIMLRHDCMAYIFLLFGFEHYRTVAGVEHLVLGTRAWVREGYT